MADVSLDRAGGGRGADLEGLHLTATPAIPTAGTSFATPAWPNPHRCGRRGKQRRHDCDGQRVRLCHFRYICLHHNGVTPLIVKAVQDLKPLFDADHDGIAKLNADNDNLRILVNTQQKQINALAAANMAKLKDQVKMLRDDLRALQKIRP